MKLLGKQVKGDWTTLIAARNDTRVYFEQHGGFASARAYLVRLKFNYDFIATGLPWRVEEFEIV